MAKITDEVGQRILELAPKMSNRGIASQLKSEGIELSHTAVANFIKEQRQERAEVTKTIVQEHIRTTVPRDLQILEEARDQLDLWRRDESLRVSERLQVIRELRATIDTRLKYAGACDAPSQDDVARMTDEELEAIVNGEG